MSRYDLNTRDSYRLKYGLNWQTDKRPTPWKTIALILFIVSALLLAQYVTDLGDKLAESQKSASHNAAYKQVVIACLNGGGFYFPDTNKAFSCTAYEI